MNTSLHVHRARPRDWHSHRLAYPTPPHTLRRRPPTLPPVLPSVSQVFRDGDADTATHRDPFDMTVDDMMNRVRSVVIAPACFVLCCGVASSHVAPPITLVFVRALRARQMKLTCAFINYSDRISLP